MKTISGKTALVLIVAALGLAGCGKKAGEAEPLRPVRFQAVFSTGGQRERMFPGVAKAKLESKLSFRVPGTLERVPVVVGDNVAAGQLIARLEQPDYRLEVQRAEAGLDVAKAQDRAAAAAYERIRLLYENNNAALNDLDRARSTAESAHASVEAADRLLKLARLKLSYTELISPVEGSIAATLAEEGENVAAGQPIVLLTSGRRPEVDIAVPEGLISQVQVGDSTRVEFDALPGRSFTARVTEVGVAALGRLAAFTVSARLEEGETEVHPGMAAQVTLYFRAGDGRERLIVPLAAVGQDQSGRFVYVAEPQDSQLAVVIRRPVEVGELTDAGLEVLSGLRDGELVVTAGVSHMRDSLRVKLPAATEN